MADIKRIAKMARGGINWIKTLYFNFHYLPIKQAIRFPILIFKNTKLYQMGGKVVLEGKITPGLIRIGQFNVGTLDMKYNRTIWQNNGTVIFKGGAKLGSGIRLSVNYGAVLTIGDKFCITGGSSIICSKEISFGRDCLLSWDILIMDTDFHNILNEDGVIINLPKPIKIGNRVWIGCRNLILKGVNICNDVVIAAGSKITKDIEVSNCIVGGTDKQRIIKENISWKS